MMQAIMSMIGKHSQSGQTGTTNSNSVNSNSSPNITSTSNSSANILSTNTGNSAPSSSLTGDTRLLASGSSSYNTSTSHSFHSQQQNYASNYRIENPQHMGSDFVAYPHFPASMTPFLWTSDRIEEGSVIGAEIVAGGEDFGGSSARDFDSSGGYATALSLGNAETGRNRAGSGASFTNATAANPLVSTSSVGDGSSNRRRLASGGISSLDSMTADSCSRSDYGGSDGSGRNLQRQMSGDLSMNRISDGYVDSETLLRSQVESVLCCIFFVINYDPPLLAQQQQQQQQQQIHSVVTYPPLQWGSGGRSATKNNRSSPFSTEEMVRNAEIFRTRATSLSRPMMAPLDGAQHLQDMQDLQSERDRRQTYLNQSPFPHKLGSEVDRRSEDERSVMTSWASDSIIPGKDMLMKRWASSVPSQESSPQAPLINQFTEPVAQESSSSADSPSDMIKRVGEYLEMLQHAADNAVNSVSSAASAMSGSESSLPEFMASDPNAIFCANAHVPRANAGEDVTEKTASASANSSINYSSSTSIPVPANAPTYSRSVPADKRPPSSVHSHQSHDQAHQINPTLPKVNFRKVFSFAEFLT
jgi:hypothetical protein